MRKQKTEKVTREVVVGEELSCDLCGFDEDETYIFEIRVEVAADGCAGTRITRDVCQDCFEDMLDPHLTPLFVVLEAGAEKHEWRIEEEGDRWYG